MTRINTAEELQEFIVAGDPRIDHDWFWNEIDIEPQAMAELCIAIAYGLEMRPGSALTLLTIGARLALRHNEQEGGFGDLDPGNL